MLLIFYDRHKMKLNKIIFIERKKLMAMCVFKHVSLSMENCFFAFNMQTCLVPVGFPTLWVKIKSKDWSQTQLKSLFHVILVVSSPLTFQSLYSFVKWGWYSHFALFLVSICGWRRGSLWLLLMCLFHHHLIKLRPADSWGQWVRRRRMF